jgi:hypothetical protein
MNQAYLLLDAAMIDNLPYRLFKLECSTVQPLFQQTAYHALAEVSPVLVPVVPDSPLAHAFTQEWSETAGIWLESEAGGTAVLQHLRSLIHARVEGDVTVFFRYYDPRITGLWLTSLQPRVRDEVMGPIRLIVLPESVHPGRFIRQEAPEQPIARYADKPWLSLSPEQLDHLSDAKRQRLVRLLIEHCQQHFPQCLQGLDLAACRRWAANCQGNAERHGYGTADEVTRWASFHAVLGENFPDAPEHAVYRQMLNEPQLSPEQRLDNLCAELQRQPLSEKERFA